MSVRIVTDKTKNTDSAVKPPSFMSWLTKEQCTFQDGTSIACWRLDWCCDEDILNEWAHYMREQYIEDDALARRCAAWDVEPNDYLARRVVPDKADRRNARSGDFAEILASDVLEHLCKFAVPRYKQRGREDKNLSGPGVDVIAYRIQDCGRESEKDELLAFEVKSNASGTSEESFRKRIEAAAKDSAKSAKDPNHVPMTLGYMIDKATDANDMQIVCDLKRFINKGGVTFKEVLGSAVITSCDTPNNALSCKLPCDVQLGVDNPLIVVHANNLMSLIHSLYDRMTR